MQKVISIIKSILYWYIPLTIITVSIDMFITTQSLSWQLAREWAIYNAYFGITLSYANAYYHRNIDKIFPWDKATKINLVLRIIGALCLNVVVIILLMMLLVGPILGGDFAEAFKPRYRDTYIICFIILLIFTSITYAISFYKEIVNEKLANEKLLREKSTAELNALRAQVDPHFLFNCFNVLSGLIDESPDKAQNFLAKLSGIYRYVLENKEEDLMALDEEIAFAKKYIELQKIRFGDNFKITIDLTHEVYTMRLPSLSLQLVLENAIKHNGFDNTRSLSIKIYNENGHLIVVNNRLPRRNLALSNGIGLSNIKSRYELHGSKEFEVLDTKETFTVKLPLL